MLVADGFVRVLFDDGVEYTFTPSLRRVEQIGEPREIVSLYAELFGPKAPQVARYILTVFCDQDDATGAVGGLNICKDAPPPANKAWWKFWANQSTNPPPKDAWIDEPIDGRIHADQQIVLAQHLMQHGMVGKAKPEKPGHASQGKYTAEFHVSEYVAAARVHLGLSRDEALSISMTEFQNLLEMKYPDTEEKKVPTRDEYDQFMKTLKERKRG